MLGVGLRLGGLWYRGVSGSDMALNKSKKERRGEGVLWKAHGAAAVAGPGPLLYNTSI